MPVRQEKKVIHDSEGNPHEYFVIQLPAMKGERLKFKLLAMLAPSVKMLKDINLKNIKGIKPEQAMELFGNILDDLFERNDPDDVVTFLENLAIGMRRDGELISKANFDQIYTDNSNEFYQACFFMLQVNFGSFFKGLNLGDALKKAKALAV